MSNDMDQSQALGDRLVRRAPGSANLPYAPLAMPDQAVYRSREVGTIWSMVSRVFRFRSRAA
ncbi:hypothetical protein [Pelagovum pacificum]|uniref:Uncharacterized protein n=1 Tax=Pelagovum pacificum TaxID=2588711 RepID=A0A5C5GG58_9RHOB|nr:hypothetical protein [Pelagovum pacificum]QQA43823.1 hypothetical protein I8N54_04390 [Pelagovum pacificum]TNY33047.1 hypothetical protein FHY64_07145 [Pelagovum pacificum]